MKRLIAFVFAAWLPMVAAAQNIDPELADVIAASSPTDVIDVIVQLQDRASLGEAAGRSNGASRRRAMIEALRTHADQSQRAVLERLRQLGATNVEPLWITNAVAASVPASSIEPLARFPLVEVVKLDGVINSLGGVFAGTAPPEWNLATIRAVPLWNIGLQGQGIVIASMDTGVDGNHPDLVGRWRGGSNSWFDPYGQHATPYDPDGHGTQSMGLMVGGDAGGTHIGVAPAAEWISVKIFDDAGDATFSAIHAGFQWLLDPDGNAATDDAPQIVNNSWGFNQNPGQCITEFEPDIAILKLADIALVFSAGNSGPGTGSDLSPANNNGGYAVGSVDSNDNIVLGSSRGPSTCDGFTFPHVVAPGQSVRSSDLSFGGNAFYASVNGTSFAAPHVTGIMALLIQATGSSSPAALEGYLINGAMDLGPSGPDNSYGFGRVDAVASYENAIGPLCQGGTFADSDADNTNDICDNCTDAPNASQFDADNDGYGNYCDGDFDNDGDTDFADYGVMRNSLFGTNPVTDLNDDGVVDFTDWGIFRNLLFQNPGPSALVP